MTTHVDELTSEVSVAPEPAPTPVAAPMPDWQAEQQLRERVRRLAVDQRRTAAEDFDD